MRHFRLMIAGLALSACALLYAPLSPVVAEEVSPVQATLFFSQTGIAPDGSVEALIRLRHEDGWHTFWQNPGEGKATKIEMTADDQLKVGAILWPLPERIVAEGNRVAGHGYTGEVYLPVRLSATPSLRVGGSVWVNATVSWLVCKKQDCVEGQAVLSSSLPVVENPVVTPAAGMSNAQVLVQTPVGWELSAHREGKLAVLEMRAPSRIVEPQFFPLTEMIWHDAAYQYGVNGNALKIAMPLDDFFRGDDSLLQGVVAYRDKDGLQNAVQVSVPLLDAPLEATFVPLGSPFQFLALAFLGGLILNLMPCVLPVLSLKALSLVKMTGQTDGVTRFDGIVYTAGVVLSFVALGGGLLLARATLGEVGWGVHLQQPLVIFSLALLMVAVGLNLSGLFEMGTSLQGLGSVGAGPGRQMGSFFTGALAVVVAAPCTAPFMASALGAALVLPAFSALGIFAALGLGLAFPYLLLCFVPITRHILPKPGAWMETLRQLLAFPMYGTAIWLLWVLGGQNGLSGMLVGLSACLLLAFSLWAWGKGGVIWRLVAGLSAMTIVALAFMLATTEPMEVGEQQNDTLSAEPYLAARLEELLTEGRPVFAYFTADWCVTCKVNERVAINREETASFFEDQGIVVLMGDWTRQDPAITEMLEIYGRAGVPLYLYFPPGATVTGAKILPQILTPSVIKASIVAD